MQNHEKLFKFSVAWNIQVTSLSEVSVFFILHQFNSGCIYANTIYFSGWRAICFYSESVFFFSRFLLLAIKQRHTITNKKKNCLLSRPQHTYCVYILHLLWSYFACVVVARLAEFVMVCVTVCAYDISLCAVLVYCECVATTAYCWLHRRCNIQITTIFILLDAKFSNLEYKD